MVDRYVPALADFQLNAAETAVIEKALQTEKPWDWISDDGNERLAMKNAKDKILSYHLQRHGGTCCYCRLNLNGVGPFMTDREHILPKGKPAYRPFSYAMWNLAAACKRCNMQFKRRGDAFVVNPDDPARFQDGANYRFIHPNFDAYSEHLTRISAQVDTRNLVMFIRATGSEKANYTHEFFALHELQVETFDLAQGATINPPETEGGDAVRALAKHFNQ